MAIHRDALEAVKSGIFHGADGEHRMHLCGEKWARPFWNFFAPFVVETENGVEYLSEDWAFCERVRQVGLQVWADPSVWLGHDGSAVITPADAKRLELATA